MQPVKAQGPKRTLSATIRRPAPPRWWPTRVARSGALGILGGSPHVVQVRAHPLLPGRPGAGRRCGLEFRPGRDRQAEPLTDPGPSGPIAGSAPSGRLDLEGHVAPTPSGTSVPHPAPDVAVGLHLDDLALRLPRLPNASLRLVPLKRRRHRVGVHRPPHGLRSSSDAGPVVGSMSVTSRQAVSTSHCTRSVTSTLWVDRGIASRQSLPKMERRWCRHRGGCPVLPTSPVRPNGSARIRWGPGGVGIRRVDRLAPGVRDLLDRTGNLVGATGFTLSPCWPLRPSVRQALSGRRFRPGIERRVRG